MGQLALVKLFARFVRGATEGSEVTADPGGGALVAAGHYASPGDDSQPLLGDYVVLVPGPGTGREVAVGYADPANTPLSEPGDKRLYSRDAGTGVAAASIWIKADGSIVVTNGTGTITLETGGDIDLNGVTIDTLGNIVATSITADSVVADSKELAGHTHLAGTEPGVTGPNQ